ncbi:MAG: Dabb family protein [Bacteroidota bacterium]|uniref:Stress responsive A/B Barrel Domain n=1 Tax=Algoriphagus faecimaris TaxID=686796 RepID=A0A1G6MBL7_9BACT|nr:Dabb family protein [Algoriphagus faecimaris]SDC52831.1 Stress responsive A/B Barrel Domain [Algoriphagus faecimaris]
MQKYLLFLPFVLIMACGTSQEKNEIVEEVKIEEKIMNQPDSVLRHVVYFSFKEASSPEDIQGVIDAFRNLQNEIEGIKAFEWGVNSSPEGLNKGLTHAFTLTFHSEADRDAYLPHPAHQRFGELLGPHLQDVTVIDYWTRE